MSSPANRTALREEENRPAPPSQQVSASAPDHDYYAQVKARKDGKRAALSEARKIVRQGRHILAELGDDALTAC